MEEKEVVETKEIAEKNKPKSSFYAKLVAFFCSRALRNTVLILLLIMSVVFMLFMDKENRFREIVFGIPYGSETFMTIFFGWLGIPIMDIKLGSWMLFFCLLIIALVFMFFQIFGPKIIRKRVQDNIEAFDNEAKAIRHYRRIYYIVVMLISLAVVFVYIMSRGILLNFVGVESVSVDINVILNMLLAILYCLAFFLLIPVAVLAVYFVIKFVMFIVALIFSWIMSLSSDIRQRSKIVDEKYKRQLEEARGVDGSVEKNASDLGYGQAVGVNVNSRYIPKTAAELFPSLVAVDEANKEENKDKTSEENKTDAEEIEMYDFTLEKFALGFQSFAINKHKIYYELPLIRSFIAGLASSRLIILQGLSGT
ncbi:MAG: hypothetical protein J6Y43_01265, partial [Clostridia bacterium]|nr:hypothetical protein [Clostridia bacterium]